MSGASSAERSRVAELLASSSSARSPEEAVRALVSLAGGLYPSVRSEALRGLTAVLEKADADGEGCGGVVECCYGCAVEVLRDDDEGVRLAAVRLVGLCAEKLAARDETEGEGRGDQMDAIFVQLSAMARDMNTKVRTEAFNNLGKMQTVSGSVLLQSLSKKVLKTDTGSGFLSKGRKIPPKLIFPCAAGIFAHGVEDEYYEVRMAASKSMGMLAKFSTEYAHKALDLLMDMMNDDSEAVILQALQALFHMAAYGHLNMQEKHMHMFLDLLIDSNALIRSAARKILEFVNLPKLQMFKSAVDGLITSLEKYPEEEEIYGVLFSIGKNHGKSSTSIAKCLATEISMASNGGLILDKLRIKALLVVSISAPFSDDKHSAHDIPAIIFGCAIPLVGKISSALGEAIDQDSLLTCLCHRGLPFCDKKSVPAEAGEFEGRSGELVGKIGVQLEQSKKKTNSLDEVLILQSIKFILGTVEEAWNSRKSHGAYEVQNILRTCKEELKMLAADSYGSTSAFLSFLCVYLDAIQWILEIWELMQSENPFTFGVTSLDFLLEKLDTSIRRMRCCFVGLTRESEVQVMELALLTNLFRLSKVGICSNLVLGKLHPIINCLEVICADEFCELSDFSKEVRKVFGSNYMGNITVGNICTLLELIQLQPKANFGTLKAVTAVLQILDNDSENPFSYICGLPVGISFDITLHNISSNDRLWLRMAGGESIQYAFLELSYFEGDDEVKNYSTVVPFYATPLAYSFVLRVCLVMECPSGTIRTQLEGHGGPIDSVVQLSDERNVYFVNTGQK